MPDSPVKCYTSVLPNRPDTKALNKLLKNMSKAIIKSPCSKPLKSITSNSPCAKKFRNSSSQQNLNGWLSKPNIDLLSIRDKPKEKTKKGRRETSNSLKTALVKVDKGTATSGSKESAKVSKTSKKSSKPTLHRFNSASSDELPTFKEGTSRKRPRQTETFKKYGVIVPSLDEIVADQKQFTNYKSQVAEAQNLREPSLKMPLSPQKSSQSEDRVLLDCKQLTLIEITEHFNSKISLLRNIINGKKFSDRHRRYFDKKKKLDNLTTKDLTYNTSTIVFTFEQIDHMIALMQTELDPEDKKTDYFFKVLVPELCLKIFMETHHMNRRQANIYLEKRPVE